MLTYIIVALFAAGTLEPDRPLILQAIPSPVASFPTFEACEAELATWLTTDDVSYQCLEVQLFEGPKIKCTGTPHETCRVYK